MKWTMTNLRQEGLQAAYAKTIHAPVINEAFLSMECTLKEVQDLSGAGITEIYGDRAGAAYFRGGSLCPRV